MEKRNAVKDEIFRMKYPNSFAAQLAAGEGKLHHCNWVSVKSWEGFDNDGERYMHQNLVCSECGQKKTISRKAETVYTEMVAPSKCPCGEDAKFVHGTKGLCCAECAKND
jgi:hypothetical protein